MCLARLRSRALRHRQGCRDDVFDAIGTAGDLTIYGKRENVKVLRNENGKMLTYEVNLCQPPTR